MLITVGFPGGDFALEQGLGRNPLIQTLTRQDSQFGFHHIEPTAVLGRVMKLDALDQAPGFDRCKGFIEGRGRVNIQVVHDQPNAFGVREVNIDQFFHAQGEVQFRTAVGDDDMPPARQRL